MRPLFQLLVLVTILAHPALGADAPAEAKDYEIKLLRPSKVGAKYAYAAEGATLQQTAVQVAGQPAQKSEAGYGIKLEGTVQVLEVSDKGEEAKVACTVKSCVRLTPAGEEVIAEPGRVITATAGDDDTTYAVDQGELSEDAVDALGLVLQLPDKKGHDDDQIFGTKERKKVGDAWPVDAKALAEDFTAEGMGVDEADASGTVTLAGAERVGEVECVKISADLEVKKIDIKQDAEELPDGFTSTGAAMKAKYSALLPLDTSRASVAESVSMNMTSTLKGRIGEGDEAADATVETRLRRAAEMKRSVLTE